MNFLTVALFFALGTYLLKTGDQRQRIALLASQLGPFQIEKLMERLNEGYLRALGETDPQLQAHAWSVHEQTERDLAQQFRRFADAFGRVDAVATRINLNPLPHAHRWLPGWLAPGFDARELMQVHAQALERAVANGALQPPRERARGLLAEMYLMQHSCHWFCRSRGLASARLLARHQTSLDQVLQAVSPDTRKAYAKVTGVQIPDAG
ncbi:hypothetical protein [Hydrogenophaga sp.]|uniref:hypothetical protein n=1 Tax=Hydrogenophaga sp. TaxID=1904254 RepID=UPI0035AEC73C